MNYGIPQEDPGKWSSLLLTIVMHVALASALIVSVRWQTRHEPVYAELWAAPPPPVAEVVGETPPAESLVPRPPEITEQAAQSPAKADITLKDPKTKPEPVNKPVAKSAPERPGFDDLLDREQARIERTTEVRNTQKQLEEQLAREQREKLDRERADRETVAAKAKADYVSRLRGKIRGNLVQPPNLKGNPTVRFLVVQLPNGEILDVRSRKASGALLYDEAVERAIRKSSPLPIPDDRSLFSRELEITYCPDPDASGRCPS